MSQTNTSDGSAGHQDDMPTDVRTSSESRDENRSGRRPSPLRLVAAGVLCVVAFFFLAIGSWGLWKDRVERDDQGFVSFGSTELKTEQYAIVGDLKGDGPGWLYGSSVIGDARVRVTSRSARPMFVGIARKDDVRAYLRGAGYATVHGFEVSAKSTHEGGPPKGLPSEQSIWATSTRGTGELTLLWSPRSGTWSIVFMNADGAANVDVRGNAGAKLPILPWLTAAVLVLGAGMGFSGALVLVRTLRSARPSPEVPPASRSSGPSVSGQSSSGAPIGVSS